MSNGSDGSPAPPPLPHPGRAATPHPAGPDRPVDPFDRIRALGVVRPDDDRWVAGVASGLAHRWGYDPVLVRGVFVAISLLGPGLFLYGVAWLLLPHPDGRIHAQEVTRGTITAGFVGSAVAILIGMSSLWGTSESAWFGVSAGPIILVGALAWWLHTRRRRGQDGAPSSPPSNPPSNLPSSPPSSTAGSTGVSTMDAGRPAANPTTYEPPTYSGGYGPEEARATAPAPSPWPPPAQAPAPPARGDRADTRPYRPLTMIVIGLAVLAAVVTHQVAGSWVATWAVALAVLGLGLVVSGFAGRRGGILVPAAIASTLLALGNMSGGSPSAGEVLLAPTTPAAAEAGLSLGAGEAVVDLTAPGLLTAATTADPLTVPVQVGAGDLTVVLPRGTATRVNVSLGAGSVRDVITGDNYDGLGRSEVLRFGSETTDPVLVVEVNQGFGQVTITEAAPTSTSTPAPSAPASPSGSPSGSSGSPSISPSVASSAAEDAATTPTGATP